MVVPVSICSSMFIEIAIEERVLNCFQFSFYSTDGDVFTLTKKIPDTITSWVVTGFSLSPNKGFALTENPSKIRVFQPFFVSTNLPYSVKRGKNLILKYVLMIAQIINYSFI